MGECFFWYRPTRVVPDQRPFKWLCVCTCLQIVPQHTITDFIPFGRRSQFFKNLSFSVYSNCRRSLSLSLPGRSLTGFGPASSAEKVWTAGGSDSGRSGAAAYSSPFVLAPPRSICPSLLDPVDHSSVLLCAYCLSADQRWLFASCVDSRGELLETTCVNIDVPFRSQRRVIAVRRSALQKLWDFLVGVMSQTTTPWRIVIGRFGRLGHGELKGTAASRATVFAPCLLCGYRDICQSYLLKLNAFSALTLLVGQQEGHLACKN